MKGGVPKADAPHSRVRRTRNEVVENAHDSKQSNVGIFVKGCRSEPSDGGDSVTDNLGGL